jgi:predicted phage-related endonuclease
MMSLQEATQLDFAGEGWLAGMDVAAPVVGIWLDGSSSTADGGRNAMSSSSAGTDTCIMAPAADASEEEAERRLRRRMSNRESARRSRARKLRRAEELQASLNVLQEEKRTMAAKLDVEVRRVLAARLDTARLQADVCALRRRLDEAQSCAGVLVEMSRLLGTSDGAVLARARTPSGL